MGRPKATLPLDGRRHLRDADRPDVYAAAGISDVIIVVGHDADAVVDAFAGTDLSATFVENPDYEQGQLSSLLAGLRVVDRPGVVASLVTLVDVPLDRRLDGPCGRRSLPGDARAHRAAGARRRARPSGADRSIAVRRAAPRGSAGGRERRRALARVRTGDVPVDDDGRVCRRRYADRVRAAPID